MSGRSHGATGGGCGHMYMHHTDKECWIVGCACHEFYTAYRAGLDRRKDQRAVKRAEKEAAK